MCVVPSQCQRLTWHIYSQAHNRQVCVCVQRAQIVNFDLTRKFNEQQKTEIKSERVCLCIRSTSDILLPHTTV